jgi:hypothetical protein
MKTINDEVFGQLTYDFQWERPEDVTILGRPYRLLLTIESESDDDESVLKVQQDAYRNFSTQHAALEHEIELRLIQYCQTELGISYCDESEFWAHNTPTSIFFPLSGGWAIMFDSDYDEESGLTAVVCGNQIEVGSQDIIL